MFDILLNSSKEQISYAAVLINNIILKTDTSKKFKDFCDPYLLNSYSHQNHDYLKVKDPKSEEVLNQEEGYIFHIYTEGKIKDDLKDKFYLLSKKLSEIYPCKIVFYERDENIFKKQHLTSWNGSYATYMKTLAFVELENKLDYILYVDLDMHILCDLRELFAINLEEKVMASVALGTGVGVSINSIDKTTELKLNSKWYNIAFSLVSLKNYKKQDINKKFFDILDNYEITHAPEELIYNFIIKDRIKLPLSYNFVLGHYMQDTFESDAMYKFESHGGYFLYSLDFYKKFLKNAKVLHYSGWCMKPWDKPIYWHNVFGLNNEMIEYACFNLWWDTALKTPYFEEYFKNLKQENERYIQNYALNILSHKIRDIFEQVKQKENNLNSFSEQVLHVKQQLSSFTEQKIQNKNEVITIKDQSYKKHLSYQLGVELIKAWKNKWGGGFIKFPFVACRIAKEFKARQLRDDKN